MELDIAQEGSFSVRLHRNLTLLSYFPITYCRAW